jgi:hypothetical protein
VGPEQQSYPLPSLPNQVCVACVLRAAASASPFALR